jgi:hypothetical protein
VALVDLAVMPPLPMMMLQRESLNQPSSHLAKRNEAVAVTAPTVALPSALRVAAGEQWKLAEPSSSGVPAGRARPRPPSCRRPRAPCRRGPSGIRRCRSRAWPAPRWARAAEVDGL